MEPELSPSPVLLHGFISLEASFCISLASSSQHTSPAWLLDVLSRSCQAYACRRDFEYLLKLQAVNAELEANLRITATAVIPQYTLSTTALKFNASLLGETSVRLRHPPALMGCSY